MHKNIQRRGGRAWGRGYAYTHVQSWRFYEMNSWEIRPASKQDIPSILWLTQLLAEFNNEPKSVKIGEKEVLRDGFGERPIFHVLLAELTSENTTAVIPAVDPERPSSSMPHNNRIIGHVLYFYAYCRGGKCLYLEDLFVLKEHRGRGIGSALMQECAKVACKEECVRMQWEVADWNTRAADMYKNIGGKIHREWLPVRMTQPELGRFAFREDNAKTKL